MTEHSIANSLSRASETDKAEFAHYLVSQLGAFGLDESDATVRQVVAALDRYARPDTGRDLG